MNDNWTVTTTHFKQERHWGVRLEWLGFEYLLAVTVNKAPAIRIVLFGVALYAGKLLEIPKVTKLVVKNVSGSKG
jgi:hypothetical protein